MDGHLKAENISKALSSLATGLERHPNSIKIWRLYHSLVLEKYWNPKNSLAQPHIKTSDIIEIYDNSIEFIEKEPLFWTSKYYYLISTSESQSDLIEFLLKMLNAFRDQFDIVADILLNLIKLFAKSNEDSSIQFLYFLFKDQNRPLSQILAMSMINDHLIGNVFVNDLELFSSKNSLICYLLNENEDLIVRFFTCSISIIDSKGIFAVFEYPFNFFYIYETATFTGGVPYFTPKKEVKNKRLLDLCKFIRSTYSCGSIFQAVTGDCHESMIPTQYFNVGKKEQFKEDLINYLRLNLNVFILFE